MKKLLVLLFIFISCLAFAQNYPELYCWDMTSNDVKELKENTELYYKLMRDLLKQEGNTTLSLIYQSGNTFILYVINVEPINDTIMLYDYDNKTLKLFYVGKNEEKVINDVSITRRNNTFTLSSVRIRFIITKTNDLFGDIGVRQPLLGI